jgi:subtilisin family serine protease
VRCLTLTLVCQLGGGIGAGYKIAYGHDFVGDGCRWMGCDVECECELTAGVDWPDEGGKVPDEDPMDHVGHGTHVAGIIAGKSEWLVVQVWNCFNLANSR